MFNFNKFYYPDEAIGGAAAIEDKELGKEDVVTLLGEDDEKDEKEEKLDLKETKEDEEEDKEDKKDELDEIEEELEEPDEEKLELMSPPRRKDILKEYPDLFKKFPYLQSAYYREQQFTKLLPTIDDAKEAVAKADVLDKFQQDLSDGNLEKAIRATKDNEVSFNKLVDNYLPNLAKVDKEAYHHIINNVIKSTLTFAMNDAKESNNDDLKAAVEIINGYLYNTKQVQQPTNLSKPKADKDPNEDINRERQELLTQKFEDSRDTINSKVNNVLKSTIEANIDPKESMSDYVRRNATRDCQEKLDSLLEGDKRLGIIIDKLWKQAASENFSKSSLDKIKSTYLSRAQTLLPGVLKQARNEALKGIGKRVREDNEDDNPPKKGPIPVGRSASNKSTSERSSGKSESAKAKEIPKGMSSYDYLGTD